MAKDFVERYSALQPFKGRSEFATLEASLLAAEACTVQAAVLKIEAMLIHAGKTKLKKTQKELINAQMTEVASSDFLSEDLFQPSLLKWAKSHLS